MVLLVKEAVELILVTMGSETELTSRTVILLAQTRSGNVRVTLEAVEEKSIKLETVLRLKSTLVR